MIRDVLRWCPQCSREFAYASLQVANGKGSKELPACCTCCVCRALPEGCAKGPLIAFLHSCGDQQYIRRQPAAEEPAPCCLCPRPIEAASTPAPAFVLASPRGAGCNQQQDGDRCRTEALLPLLTFAAACRLVPAAPVTRLVLRSACPLAPAEHVCAGKAGQAGEEKQPALLPSLQLQPATISWT